MSAGNVCCVLYHRKQSLNLLRVIKKLQFNALQIAARSFIDMAAVSERLQANCKQVKSERNARGRSVRERERGRGRLD